MRTLADAVDRIKTYATMEGDAEKLIPLLPAGLRFIAIAQGSSWADAISLVKRLTVPGELVVDRDGVQLLAVACLRLHRRVLCICKPGPEAEALKAALAAEVAGR